MKGDDIWFVPLLLSCVCFLVGIFILYSNHPYCLGAGVLVESISIGLLSAYNYSIFISCTIVLVFSSGIMVLFLFTSSLWEAYEHSVGGSKNSITKKMMEVWTINKSQITLILQMGGLKKTLVGILILFYLQWAVGGLEFLASILSPYSGEAMTEVFHWRQDPVYGDMVGGILIGLGLLLLFTVVVVVRLSSSKGAGALVAGSAGSLLKNSKESK